MPLDLPLDGLLNNLPMTEGLKFLIYLFLIVGFIVFVYKNLIKDIIEQVRLSKKQKKDSEEEFSCEDEYLTQHGFFNLMYRYIKVDLDKLFDLNIKKDAQFYLLGKCKFVCAYNALNKAVKDTLDDNLNYKGKKIDKIDFNVMLDVRQSTIDEYEKMFLDNGGNKYVLEKFNEYISRRSSSITEMLNYLSEQEFFNKDNRNTVMGLLTVYMYAFVQTYEDLKEDHKKINGSLNAELEKFDLTPDFIRRAKAIDITR